MQRNEPRLEKRKHLLAERRLETSILEGRDYEGKDEDIALVRRKRHELGDERLRRAVGYGQHGTSKGRRVGYGN
jgi:hypothetical protein